MKKVKKIPRTPVIRDWKKEALKYRKALVLITNHVCNATAAIDTEMKKPVSLDRGERLARICNALDMEKDLIRHFTLGQKLDKPR